MATNKSTIKKAILRVQEILRNEKISATTKAQREAQLASLQERYDNFGIPINGKANDGIVEPEKPGTEKKPKFTIDRVLGIKKFENGDEVMLSDDEIALLDSGKEA